MKSSMSKIKTPIRSQANRIEQAENKVSGMEDKVEELHQSGKDHEKILRKYEWNMKTSGTPSKDQTYKSWV
jgi:hypothetical protein